MSSPETTTGITQTEWVPQWVPSGSQTHPRDTARRVGPGSPLPSGGTHSTSPSPLGPTSGSHTHSTDHFNEHLHSATRAAQILDPHDVQALLLTCPRCSACAGQPVDVGA